MSRTAFFGVKLVSRDRRPSLVMEQRHSNPLERRRVERMADGSMGGWNSGPTQGVQWGASGQDGSGGPYEYVSLDAHEVGCDTVANLLFSAGYEVGASGPLCPVPPGCASPRPLGSRDCGALWVLCSSREGW